MSDKKINADRNSIIKQLHSLLEPWLPNSDMTKEINENTNILMDLGIDSVGILQLILGVEKEFNITIKNHELDSDVFSKMKNLIDIIEGKVNETD